MTGIRVNEGMALWWNDIDFDKKRMRVHHMLILKSRKNWQRNAYTKTSDGKRIISLDDDTISILKRWKDRQKEIGLGNETDFIFTYDSLPMIKSTKHYSHLWRGADESIAEIMSGNISIHTAPKTKIQFNGNQNLKR